MSASVAINNLLQTLIWMALITQYKYDHDDS